MVLYNLYLVLNNEGLSENIPDELMHELVHDVTIVHEKNIIEHIS